MSTILSYDGTIATTHVTFANPFSDAALQLLRLSLKDDNGNIIDLFNTPTVNNLIQVSYDNSTWMTFAKYPAIIDGSYPDQYNSYGYSANGINATFDALSLSSISQFYVKLNQFDRENSLSPFSEIQTF